MFKEIASLARRLVQDYPKEREKKESARKQLELDNEQFEKAFKEKRDAIRNTKLTGCVGNDRDERVEDLKFAVCYLFTVVLGVLFAQLIFSLFISFLTFLANA